MKRGSTQKTVKTLLGYREKGIIRYDLPFQRNSVWKNDRRSFLIDSVIRDKYVPPLLVWDNGDGNLWFFDGRQRTESVFFFHDDLYKLSQGTPDFGDEVLAGKKHKDLGKTSSFEFLTYNFTVTEFRDCSLEEIQDLYYRVNQSMALTATEKTRARLAHDVKDALDAITKDNPFFDLIALTNDDRNRSVDEQMLWQFLAVTMGENIDFGGQSLNKFITGLNEVPSDVSCTVETQLEYLTSAFQSWEEKERKALRKVHVGSLYQVVNYAQSLNWSESQFGLWAKSFLIDKYSPDNQYGRLCQKGATSKQMIADRVQLMRCDMEDFPVQLEFE
ncbi:hypothetical protein A8L34_27800 [Bacillus sp. FJAT-27264]|uniref:DUF262 domain-containing protein n=1 Tax=Paenibacillus sp. (strain DSM 101736 / FJAT-27264) TaxID=1850362 RepID=UPI000807EF1D|nr:DUF262 domain-containing protein [Bacillus sp. FJAT-27264]OBZ15854.1 hypothetical protein A8L34_27800 [Bacillus sp. FJAT-27264]